MIVYACVIQCRINCAICKADLIKLTNPQIMHKGGLASYTDDLWDYIMENTAHNMTTFQGVSCANNETREPRSAPTLTINNFAEEVLAFIEGMHIYQVSDLHTM